MNPFDDLPDKRKAFEELPDKGSLKTLPPLIDAGLNAVPGLGAVKQLTDKLSESPTARRVAVQTGTMGVGAEVGSGAMAPIMAAGVAAPEVIAPAVGLAMAGAGAGNVIGGIINDLHDDPKAAQDAISVLFDPAQANLINMFRSNPDEAIQTAKRLFGRFSEGAIAQMFSVGLSSLAPHPGGVFDIGSKAIPGVEEAMRSQGYSPDAAQFTKSRVAQVMKSVATQGMFGNEAMVKAAEGNEVVAAKNIDDLTTSLAGGLKEKLAPSELAKLITSTNKELAEPLHQEISNHLYTQLSDTVMGPEQTFYQSGPSGEMTPVKMRPTGPLVSMVGMKAVAQDMRASTPGKIQSAFAENIGPALDAIDKAPDVTDFETAHAIRSRVLYAVRNSNNSTLVSLAKQASAAVDKSMEQAVLNSGKAYAYDMWRGIDGFYKSGKEAFNNDLVAKLFIQDGSQAEKVGRNLMSNGNTTQIQALNQVFKRVDEMASNPTYAETFHKVLSKASPETQQLVLKAQQEGTSIGDALRNRLKAGTVQDLLSPYTKINANKTTGYDINYGAAMNDFDPKANPEGYAKFKELYGEKGVAQLRNTLEMAGRATTNNAAAYDRAVYWAERVMGGVIGEAAGSMIGHRGIGFMMGETAGLFGLPKAASYLMTDPVASKYFVNGVKMLSENTTPIAIKTGVDSILKAATAWTDANLINKSGEQ